MKKVFVVGDSISIHYGPFLASYLRGIAEYARKGAEDGRVTDLDTGGGANGGDSSMVLDYLLARERSGGIQADLLLLNCGLHDIKTDITTQRKQVPIDEYASNLKQILACAGRMGLLPVWIRTTPCDERVHNRPDSTFHRFADDCAAYNRAADEIVHAEGVPVIDLFTFTSNLGDDLYCDHVHFHDHIREKQGAFIAGWVAAWLCRAQG